MISFLKIIIISRLFAELTREDDHFIIKICTKSSCAISDLKMKVVTEINRRR